MNTETASAHNESEWELLAEVGVDSGQLLLVDPCYIENHWKTDQFKDLRQYRHVTTGDVLEFRKDFSNYEQTIERYGKTMNQLNATGEWKPIDRPMPDGMSYNACCHATLSDAQGGQVDLGAAFSTGYGDGLYPVFVKRNAEGRIMQVLIDFEDDDEVAA